MRNEIRSALAMTLFALLASGIAAADPGAMVHSDDSIAIVVHGMSSTTELGPLIEDVGRRGYHAYPFHYDDTQPLDRSATELGEFVEALIAEHPAPRIAIVAHSMGGLVARRALTIGHPAGLATRSEPVVLVTTASPFGGFLIASFSVLDFGLGPKSFRDLGSLSEFIRDPGELGPNVRHVKVETDEEGPLRGLGDARTADDPVPLGH